MVGDRIGEERGKVTSRRVLRSGDPRYLKLEISFEAEGTIYGVACQDFGTYEVFERIPGQLYGEGQGMLHTRDGESAIWTGHGVGTVTPDGTLKFAASVTYQAHATGKFARLNGVLGLIEHTVGSDGSARSTLTEWKA